MGARLNSAALAAIEAGLSLVPRARPPAAAIAAARIVSHRGERDNQYVHENTFAAFDRLRGSGVRGIEFDLRWTRDLEPVVCHDPDLRRVFGLPLRLADTDFADLRVACPQVPHLDEFLQRYAGHFHLFLEIKAEVFSQPERQHARLMRALHGLAPGRDFHVLALDTRSYGYFDSLPARCRLPVARLNSRAMSDYALRHGCAGVAGPYFGFSARLIADHHAAGQVVGVGFPATRAIVQREIGRGVDWIFSNQALKLQRYLNAASSN